MKNVMMIATLLFALVPAAHAKNVTLTGDDASKFIERHFPDAEIPGPVRDVFKYTNKHGQVRRGYADCYYPAMGGHSNGEVTTCDVIY